MDNPSTKEDKEMTVQGFKHLALPKPTREEINSKLFTPECFTYPYKEHNSILYDEVVKHCINNTNGGGSRSTMQLHKKNILSINTLVRWIENLSPLVAHNFMHPDKLTPKDIPEMIENYNIMIRRDHINGGGAGGFYVTNFKVHECWGMYYNIGAELIEHCHYPYAISFIYYVKTPESSAPLILEGKKIKPIAGQAIFFPGHQIHSVPYCDVKDRCCIVGNLIYTGDSK